MNASQATLCTYEMRRNIFWNFQSATSSLFAEPKGGLLSFLPLLLFHFNLSFGLICKPYWHDRLRFSCEDNDPLGQPTRLPKPGGAVMAVIFYLFEPNSTDEG